MQQLAGDARRAILFLRASPTAEAAIGARFLLRLAVPMLLCFALRIDGPRWRAGDRRAGRVFDGLVFEAR